MGGRRGEDRTGRLGRALALLCASVWAAAAAAAADDGRWERDVARARGAYPGLLELRREGDSEKLVGADESGVRALLDAIRAGQWSDDSAAALRVLFGGLSRQQGALATSGRILLSEATEAAVKSGSRAAVRGMAALLGEIMEDLSSQYSILAQDLLSESIRCAAASLDDKALLQRVSAQVNPDRELDLADRDRAVADRFALHRSANLFAVAARGDRVVAAGDFGTLLVSDDAGRRFAAPATGTDQTLYSVELGPGDEIWAAGRDGVVLRSTDAGRGWRRRPTPFQRHLFGLFAPAPGAVLAVGDFGLQLRSRDGGAVWECMPREDVILGGVARAGADAVIFGEFGTLERLQGWDPPARASQLFGVPADMYVFDVWFDAAGEGGLAVGLAGAVLRSSDGGASFTRVAVPFDADLYGVAGSGQAVVLVGEGGLVAYSDDGGRSFAEAARPPLPLPLLAAAFATAERVYVVGSRGNVLASGDAGRRFELVHGPAVPEPAP